MRTGTAAWDVSEQDFPKAADIETQLRFLLRFAILAPSPQNSQPWAFAVRENQVYLMANFARSQPVSDPGRRELYLSLGCALENLLAAAEHFGFAHSVSYFPERRNPLLAATVLFRPGGQISPQRARATPDAILHRHNEPGVFSPAPIPESLRQDLEACGTEPDLALDLTDDHRFRNWIEALTVASDTTDFANPAFRMELAYWTGQGAFAAEPRGAQLATLSARTGHADGMVLQGYSRVESAPLLGLIRTTGDGHLSHVRAGQLFERMWLTATTAGVSVNPMSQTMRRPELRSAIAALIPYPGWIPQHVFRIGYPLNPRAQRSPRRPVEEVLVR